jgi:hypothetical protein
MISPMHGRVKGIEELHHRVEIEVSKNNELPGMSRHAFPELRVINGCEEIVLDVFQVFRMAHMEFTSLP